MNKNDKIFVAGSSGLVGSAIVRKLTAEGYTNLITISSKDLDLRNQQAVNMFFAITKPEVVYLCAGIVGGIVANNTRRAEFIYDNIMIQTNVIHAAYLHGVKKLLALGSACSYPRISPQPISEERLLMGELEPTNEPYAISKIAALKTCDSYRHQYGCNFISATPTNIYGFENENFDLTSSHVLPALIRKLITAKHERTEMVTWGTGKVRREFMHSDDAADGCVFLMNNYNEAGHINLGTGVDHELNDVVKIISEIIGFDGKITHETSKPDGMVLRKLNVSKINNLGWKSKIKLREGLEMVISRIMENKTYESW